MTACFYYFLQVIGCILIGYMAWVLATSVTVHRFLNGDMFWSYSVITLGFSLFFSGLVGWVGGASESICLVRYVHHHGVNSSNFDIFPKITKKKFKKT